MQRDTSQANSHQNGDSEHSPIRQQYLGVKRQHPDALLFFRMGDFYEMFDDDAELAARELEITLTRRDWGRGERTAMAGIPHHAADGYIARLIAKGYRVAVCEQVSDPALSKGLVEREVIRVVTPGTIVDPTMLAAKRNNYLAAAVLSRDAVGIAYADITTGEFACTQFSATQPEIALTQELARVQPAEVLIEATAPRRMALPRTQPPLLRGEGEPEARLVPLSLWGRGQGRGPTTSRSRWRGGSPGWMAACRPSSPPSMRATSARMSPASDCASSLASPRSKRSAASGCPWRSGPPEPSSPICARPSATPWRRWPRSKPTASAAS